MIISLNCVYKLKVQIKSKCPRCILKLHVFSSFTLKLVNVSFYFKNTEGKTIPLTIK